MEPIKIEVAISVNVDLSQGTKDFVSRIVDTRTAAQLESVKKSSAILTQLLEVLRTPIPVCGEITPKGPIELNGKPIATEAQIKSDAMNEAAKAAEEKKPEPSKKKQEPEKTISIEDVRAVLTTKVNDHREAIRSKLESFGAKSVTTLDPSKYQEMHDFLISL